MTRTRHHNNSLSALICLILLCLTFTSNAASEQYLGGRDSYAMLGESLCNSYNVDDDTTISMKRTIKYSMEKVEGNANPTDKEIITFLNTHKNKLTCWGKHYLMKAFDEGVYMTVYKKLFKKDLYKKGEYQIDYNSITLTYNPETRQEEPMTILDYIENVALKDRSISNSTTETRNVRYLENMIRKRFGALYYYELPEAERAAFHTWQATLKK